MGRDWSIIEGNLPSFHCSWSKIDSTLSSFINLRSTEAIWLEHKTGGDMPGLYKSACLVQMPFDILGTLGCRQWNREWCHYFCIPIMIIVRCSSSQRSRVRVAGWMAILKPFNVKWLRFNSRVHCKFISLSVLRTLTGMLRRNLCFSSTLSAVYFTFMSCTSNLFVIVRPAMPCHSGQFKARAEFYFLSILCRIKKATTWLVLCVRAGPGWNKSGLRVSVRDFSEYLFSIMR